MRLKTNFSYLQTWCFQYEMEINNTVIYVLRRDLYHKANYQCGETSCHPASLTFLTTMPMEEFGSSPEE